MRFARSHAQIIALAPDIRGLDAGDFAGRKGRFGILIWGDERKQWRGGTGVPGLWRAIGNAFFAEAEPATGALRELLDDLCESGASGDGDGEFL